MPRKQLNEQKTNGATAFDKDTVVADLRKQLELKDRDLRKSYLISCS